MTKKETEATNNEEPKGMKGIVPFGISKEMRQSYIDYAMTVITSRAIPDVRDGMKPVHRRIMYTMHELGLAAGGKTRKCAKITGDVTGNYHPHGDAAVYQSLVNLAQDFSMRYPLVIGQGNFGSIDGDNAAAPRYTEAKMSKIAMETLKNIEKNTVDYRPNYENTRQEPSVLPTNVPNLVINGTLGIAVGMATNIPPHNLTEVVDATIHLIDNPKATMDDMMKFIKGPDFPVGGIAFNKKDIKTASSTGRGGVVVRGEAEIVEGKRGAFNIIITSIPYRVNKANLIEKIADLVHAKKIIGIRDVRDESTTIDDMRVVVELKGTAHPQSILNLLYKHTQLEDKFNYNMLALVGGVPKTLSIKAMLEEFVKHRIDVVTRRTQFELDKAQAREHILLGLKKALDHIDAIIKLIKASKDAPTAHAGLMKKYKFSEIQATAILEMKLQKLAGLERKKIEDELKTIQALIKDLLALLKSKVRLMNVIKEELTAVKDKYGDARRTKIVAHGAKNFKMEDLIADEESVLVLTKGGYIKRTDPNEYKAQKRGGVGVIDMNTKEEDVVRTFLTAGAHSDLLFFTDKGRVYKTKMYEIPEGKRSTKGKSIMNFLQMEQDENVTSVLPMPKDIKDAEGLSLIMVTRGGTVKKTEASQFHDVRRSGLIAINLKGSERLISAQFVAKGDDVVLVTHGGQAIRFAEKDARAMGRTAAGVRGIKLGKDDYVVGSGIVKKDSTKQALLVLSEGGIGKKTKMREYKVQGRGGSGLKTVQMGSKVKALIGASVIDRDGGELVAVSKNGVVIRTALDEVPTLGRATQGVKIMKLKEGDSVATMLTMHD